MELDPMNRKFKQIETGKCWSLFIHAIHIYDNKARNTKDGDYWKNGAYLYETSDVKNNELFS